MTEDLTARQSQILGMLRLSVKERGYPPSVREIGSAVGLASSSVARQLHELEDKGHIVRDPNKPRALRIVDDPDDEARLQAARSEGWKVGHAGCVCDRPGATPCRNPYEEGGA